MAHHDTTGERVPRISRRRALASMGGIGAAGALAGCHVQVSEDSAGTGGSPPPMTIPDPQVELPTQQVTLRWMDTGLRKSYFEKPVFEAYHEKHRNIEIEYTGTGFPQLNKVIPLGIRNGTAPDVFSKPSNVPSETAIAEGWVRPAEDLIPNFEEWKSTFPEGIFVPGAHLFDGKLYSVPISRSKQVHFVFDYDVEYLKEAGVDAPEEQITSWDELRKVAKKVTENGNGRYYGILGTKTNNQLVPGLAQASGWLGGMNHKTGEYEYSHELVLQALEFALAMRDDGSFFPDSGSLEQVDARGRMPNRVAAFFIDGPIGYLDWRKKAPDWKFDLKRMPSQDGSADYVVPYVEQGTNASWVYNKTELPNVIGDLYAYMTSLEGQIQMVLQTRGQLTPLLPEALERADVKNALDPAARKAQELADQLCRRAPQPVVRNPEIAQVELKAKTVRPSFEDILEGSFTGQVDDYRKALRGLDSALNKNLDQALATARKSGADVSREDYVFGNWDPQQDYTNEDYQDLP